MNKRAEHIKSLFTAPQIDAPVPAEEGRLSPPRVAAGSVRALRDSFTDFERENEDLRRRMTAGAAVIEVDPTLIDPSPVQDRFAEQDSASFDALKASMAQYGQEVPVLIREHPTVPGRYQIAYGHRRVRAAREIGRPVRAVLRKLTDQELIVAQGLENSAREDLSFIERAVFAKTLEDKGYDRSVIQAALSVDRAEASKLVSVARAVPGDLVQRIGRAPKVGRGRWQTLAEALDEAGALARAQAAAARPEFPAYDSDYRFVAVLSAVAAPAPPRPVARSGDGSVVTAGGRRIARAECAGRQVKVILDRRTEAEFAAFIVAQLPRLFDAFVAGKAGDEGVAAASNSPS